MLKHVRSGQNVVGVFYGHPAAFVLPSHRTIANARNEGYAAKILPGISLEDCVYADLNIDPASSGCLTYEATDLLLSDRTLVPSSHLILHQVGAVGVADFNSKGFDVRCFSYAWYIGCVGLTLLIQNANFKFLIDRLEIVYGPEHSVIHYIAAILPFAEATIEKYTIAELRDPDSQHKIQANSTFYLPPKVLLKHDRELAEMMGILKPGQEIVPPKISSSKLVQQNVSTSRAYGDYVRAAISQLETRVTPASYRPLSASPAMQDVMIKLALDPKALAEYQSNPTLFTDSTSGLMPPEKVALQNAHEGLIMSEMKGQPILFAHNMFLFELNHVVGGAPDVSAAQLSAVAFVVLPERKKHACACCRG